MALEPNHSRSLKITFLHPGLGIGGSERLVIEAALGLQQKGHRVKVVTAHYRPRDSLASALASQLDLRICRPIVPSSIGCRLRVLCSILQMMLLVGELRRFENDSHVVFCDLVPHVIPFIRRVSRAKVVYYCHYPDLLLTAERDLVYGLYRRPFDYLEEVGTAMAHAIVVNSLFTKGVLLETFPRLSASRVSVLYPGVDLSLSGQGGASPPTASLTHHSMPLLLLSINRFDPRKNLGLALESLAQLERLVPREVFAGVRLIIAGGYDESLPEQRYLLHNLQEMALTLGLQDRVVFRLNVSEEERLDLLQRCFCLVYTSPSEHFGLGIVEAMAARKAVVAVREGGPLEIVRDGETGILCDPSPQAFSEALANFVAQPERTRDMGMNGRRRVERHFSKETFATQLDAIVQATVGGN
jgi:alpha-1,3/alpha-1,6-mannosyltransferase